MKRDGAAGFGTATMSERLRNYRAPLEPPEGLARRILQTCRARGLRTRPEPRPDFAVK